MSRNGLRGGFFLASLWMWLWHRPLLAVGAVPTVPLQPCRRRKPRRLEPSSLCDDVHWVLVSVK